MSQAAATSAGRYRLRPARPLVPWDFLRCFQVRTGYCFLGFAVLSVSPLVAQAADSAPPSAAVAPPGSAAVQPPAPPTRGSEGNEKESSPSAENILWDGKTWHAIDKSLFEARFKRYLDAPEKTTVEDVEYQGIVSKILELTAPGNASTQNTDAALRLLPRASSFGGDARLCDCLADAISTCFRSLRNKERVDAERKAQEAEKTAPPEWKMRLLGARKPATGGDTAPATGIAAKARIPSAQQSSPDPSAQRSSLDPSDQTQCAVPVPNFEHEVKVTTDQVKAELSVIQAKVEFQAVIVQLFLQRRFQHVLMATRFYRAVFTDGDTKLNVSRDTKALFEKNAGIPPTVGTLESLAHEAMFRVHEDVQAYEFLAQKGDLETAVKRLAQGFTIGEYLPEIGALPREMKRRALDTPGNSTGAPQP